METIQKQNEHNEIERILGELEKEEQLNSLHYLVQKLPEFVKATQAVDEQLSFIQSVLADKQSLSTLAAECESRWDSLHITNEHFDSLVKITHLLPRIVPRLEKLEEAVQFVENVLHDKQSVDYFLRSLNDNVALQRGLEIFNETNERFSQESDTNITILKMYRLLKDPMLQKGFRYIETLLGVIQTKK
ncbi:hypothetical protein [Bacillus marasmi]|uniref:hypothetical protein n=1 Tax=Bacillus marasmi TaxID=1926279 RepID=UPI0011C9EDE7|nr:hypothetical protein [Bacillus marasmi]